MTQQATTQAKMTRPIIKEAVIVEGRDDVDVVQKAVDTLIIPTHGFGITAKTYELIARAYEEKGIIILTDPDYSGEEIRRKLSERFPKAKHAYVARELATRDGDIGIENARPEDVLDAIRKAHAVSDSQSESEKSGQAGQSGQADQSRPKKIEKKDILRLGLVGTKNASALRAKTAEKLGIGYGNSKGLLRMLNGYGISIEELEKAVEWAVNTLSP
jgi:ribonuclease M5